jgi:hypothetical protein
MSDSAILLQIDRSMGPNFRVADHPEFSRMVARNGDCRHLKTADRKLDRSCDAV